MKRICNLFIICFILLCFSSVYAVGIDMDLNNDISNTDNTILEDDYNSIIENNISDSIDNSTEDIPSSPKVSTTETEEDFTLSISDIIDIILISVGIVLIFLAIAILIKIR